MLQTDCPYVVWLQGNSARFHGYIQSDVNLDTEELFASETFYLIYWRMDGHVEKQEQNIGWKGSIITHVYAMESSNMVDYIHIKPEKA